VRVLFISDVYFPRVNGVSTSIRTFRHDLANCAVDSLLVAPRYAPAGAHTTTSDAAALATDAAPGTAELPEENGVLRVPAGRVPGDPEDRRMSWRALTCTLDALPRGEFDLVHIHTPFIAHYAGVRCARRAGVPCVATYHTFFEEYLHHYVPALPRAMSRLLARSFSRSQCAAVQALIAPSEPLREVLESYGVRTPIHILPTGLAPDRFRRGDGRAFRERAGIAPERPVVTYIGRVAHEKNIGFLVQMFGEVLKSVPAALLVIAGEGPARAALRAQVAACGLTAQVHFAGYLERDGALLDCYAAADVFVFASRTETQGLVLLEALAQGRPVVSTAYLGTAAVLREGAGARIVPEEPAAFADAIAALLRDPAQAAALGGRARTYAQEWASARMARRLADLYRELAAPRQRSAHAA
jgi:1,2-diacylglycerol 3-alpha-glucosyltransferase